MLGQRSAATWGCVWIRACPAPSPRERHKYIRAGEPRIERIAVRNAFGTCSGVLNPTVSPCRVYLSGSSLAAVRPFPNASQVVFNPESQEWRQDKYGGKPGPLTEVF
jgi:hypothetical protein